MKTETVKGFKDYTGEEAIRRADIRRIVEDTFRSYGFEPAETPVVEYADFVKGDNGRDEAVSDIFKLQDKGKRKLALRYEFTFQLKRIMKDKKLPYKRYSMGPVFRDEPISGNRTRQFISNDLDVIGASIRDQAEVLAVASEILKKSGINGTIYINNRKLLNEILEEQGVKDKESVIREIDKLDKMSEKDVKVSSKVLAMFKRPESAFKRYDSYKEIEELKKYCKLFGVDVKFLPTLARGLSYYDGNIFEIKTREIRETIFGGGAYTFSGVPSFGFGVSLERLNAVAKMNSSRGRYLVVSLEQDEEAIALAQKLRDSGKNASVYYGKPSKALEYANSYNFTQVVFVGLREVKEKKFKVKDMVSGNESLLRI